MALLKAAAEKGSAPGLTMHLQGTETDVTTIAGAREEEKIVLEVDAVSPTTLRLKGRYSMANGMTVPIEMVTVDGVTAYMRSPGYFEWRQVPDRQTAGPLSIRTSMRATVTAATSVRILRTEAVNGVPCTVLEVRLDALAYEKADPASTLGKSVAEALGVHQKEVDALLKTAVDTEMLWIGTEDLLTYREVDRTLVDAGAKGTYEERSDATYSAYGEKIVPPITVPSPIESPSPMPFAL